MTTDRREFIRAATGMAASLWVGGLAAAAQPRRSAPLAIDCHAHWQPEGYLKAMAELGRPVNNAERMHYDLELRLKRMDEQRVTLHVLTLLTPGLHWAPPDAGVRLARIVNDAAAAAHTAFPDRFLAGVAMPIQSPSLALEELNRVAGRPGIRAVHLPTSNDAKDYLFDKAFEPIFARCEELGYPLLFHPIGAVAGGERLEGPHFLTNTVGFPLETAIIAAKFIVNGVLDKFPRLEIVLPHSGGAFPYLAGRIEHGSAGSAKLQRPFKYYVRRFHYDTITYYPETLRFLIDLVGADRVVLGSDNYARMDLAQPRELVDAADIPAADKQRILVGNATRLFRV